MFAGTSDAEDAVASGTQSSPAASLAAGVFAAAFGLTISGNDLEAAR